MELGIDVAICVLERSCMEDRRKVHGPSGDQCGTVPERQRTPVPPAVSHDRMVCPSGPQIPGTKPPPTMCWGLCMPRSVFRAMPHDI